MSTILTHFFTLKPLGTSPSKRRKMEEMQEDGNANNSGNEGASSSYSIPPYGPTGAEGSSASRSPSRSGSGSDSDSSSESDEEEDNQSPIWLSIIKTTLTELLSVIERKDESINPSETVAEFGEEEMNEMQDKSESDEKLQEVEPPPVSEEPSVSSSG